MSVTRAALWGRLAPYVQAFGPKDAEARPAVLLFHDCGGLRDHHFDYARAAAAVGVRAFVIDSFGPRGWNSLYAQMTVCTGLHFWGRERAGDVLAALTAIAARPDVDASRIALAGWSHGGWAVMDLMAMPLTTAGEADLSDPSPEPLKGVKALFLAYPFSGPGALSRHRPWAHRPERVLGVIPHRDHLASPDQARAVFEAARRAGSEVELWELPDGTHCFEQPGTPFPMRHDAGATAEAIRRFAAFLKSALAPD